eukprot:GHVU01128576.1.p1 GENE.GHVU01128576.1~~GHVU01128576.1.p1  ORF type:complete len:109 (-),score=4.73 GHVU01128576.1:29-355(-)
MGTGRMYNRCALDSVRGLGPDGSQARPSLCLPSSWSGSILPPSAAASRLPPHPAEGRRNGCFAISSAQAVPRRRSSFASSSPAMKLCVWGPMDGWAGNFNVSGLRCAN